MICRTSWKRKGTGLSHDLFFVFLFFFGPRHTSPLLLDTESSSPLIALTHFDHGRVDEDEIDDRCDKLRQKLQEQQKKRRGGPARREFKAHEVHGIADAKARESERLRNALKISRNYQEGDHWRKQDERRAAFEKAGAKQQDNRQD